MSQEVKNNNDFPEKDEIRKEAVALILNAFKMQKQGRVISRTIGNFWTKARSRASQELVNAVETQPEAPETAPALDAFMKEQMDKIQFFMSVMVMVENFKQKG